MAYRTTITTLRTLVGTLNHLTGHSREAYVRDDAGQLRASVGTYVLDCVYGGYRLAQIVNEMGGERGITPRYGAAIAADLIRAYMSGIQSGSQSVLANLAANTIKEEEAA